MQTGEKFPRIPAGIFLKTYSRDFRVLIATSSNFSSYSHVLTNDSRSHTEGAINKISSAYNTILKLHVDEHDVVKSSK